MALINWFKGKRTYLIAIATAVYGLGIASGWWQHSVAVDAILGGGGLAALRAGITNETNKTP